jgi:tetratricopeptide (TPR) repeat protein
MKRDALPIFNYVVKLNPETPEAKCSALMLAIDTQEKYEENFAALEKLQQSHPDDPLLLWMTAVACRELGKRGAPKVYSEKGAQYYAKLLETLNPGPVLLHQTCANILSEELGKHEEALKHREIAVRLEPAPWSYQGMANTLTYLGRYADADVNYKKSVEMAPDDPTYLASWAWSMEKRNENEKAFGLYKKAADLAPNHPKSWRNLAECATKLNRPEEAAKYNSKAESLEKAQK